MLQSMMPEAARLMQATGWALLHSLWQAALIHLVLMTIFRTIRDMSAGLKHGCALMGLLLLSIWVSNTAVTQWHQLGTVEIRVSPGDALAASGYTIEVQPTAAQLNLISGTALGRLETAMPWLMALYVTGLLLMLIRLGTSLGRLHSLRTRGLTLPDSRLTESMHSLQLHLGLAQHVLLRLSTRVAVPVVIGVLRPLILLPATMIEDMSPEELEAILLHELAHISRADFLINVFQSVMETLLFFNPFVWRISAVIRREREHCCDDLVIDYTEQPLTYARALTTLALKQQSGAPSMALAASGEPPLLFNRIKRIIEMKNNPLRYGHIIAACSLAAIILTVSIVCFTPSLAQRSKKEERRKAAASTTNAQKIIVIEKNGTRHVYRNADALPARERKQLEKGLKALKKAENALAELEESMASVPQAPAPPKPPVPPLPPAVASAPKAPAAPPAPPAEGEEPAEPAEPAEAPEPAEPAGPGYHSSFAPVRVDVDWTALRKQVDSALASVDWNAVDRELANQAGKVRIVIDDPRLRAQIRRSVELARREIAMGARERERALAESRRVIALSQRNMEQVQREMERALRAAERYREDEARRRKREK